MNDMRKILVLWLLVVLATSMQAQEKIINPDISYAGIPRSYTIGGIAVSGVDGYEDFVLTGISGLSEGQTVTIPGNEVTDAVKRYWRHGLFSTVATKSTCISI